MPAGQTLTVQGGAVIKLWGGHVYVNGTLNVTGSVANPAVFTSWNDGTVGLPVGTGAPAPSQWRRIHFTQNADGSVLVGAVVRFAGAYSAGALICDQADITLTDCTITDNGSPGLYGSNNSFPTVSGCTFANCVGDAVTTFAVGALPGFSGNFAYGNTTGDFIRITLGTFTGNLVIGPDCGMNGNGVVVIDNDLVVAAGQTLTVAAGTIIEVARIPAPLRVWHPAEPGNLRGTRDPDLLRRRHRRRRHEQERRRDPAPTLELAQGPLRPGLRCQHLGPYRSPLRRCLLLRWGRARSSRHHAHPLHQSATAEPTGSTAATTPSRP